VARKNMIVVDELVLNKQDQPQIYRSVKAGVIRIIFTERQHSPVLAMSKASLRLSVSHTLLFYQRDKLGSQDFHCQIREFYEFERSHPDRSG